MQIGQISEFLCGIDVCVIQFYRIGFVAIREDAPSPLYIYNLPPFPGTKDTPCGHKIGLCIDPHLTAIFNW